MRTFKLTLCVAAAVALVGCSTMQEIREDARTTHEDAVDSASSLMAGRASRGTGPVQGPVVTDIPFVDVNPVPIATRYPLVFNRIVMFNEPIGVPLPTLAQRVRDLTGLTVTYQTEIVDPQARGGNSGMPQVDSTFANLPPLPNSISLTGMPEQEVSTGVAITYSGPVKGLFDAIANSTNSSWEYDDSTGRVNFFKYRTSVFRIAAVQGATESSARMGGKSESSSGSAEGQSLETASAEASHKTDGSVWAGVEGSLAKLVSPAGVFYVNQAAGTVMVRDVPERMTVIAKYIDDMNAAMSRQVDIEVTVYRVLVRDKDTRGLNWNVMFQNLIETSAYNLGLSTLRPDVASNGLSSAIISVPQFDENGVPHRYGGSQLFLDALSTLGRTSVMTNTSVMTSNNQPAPVKVVRRTSYLAETTPTFGGSAGNAISTGAALTPGTVETGLNLYVLPHVQDDGKRMLLKLMVSLSTLEAMETYSSGENSIQLPQVASREFQQQAWLNSGETLVLAGFEQIDAGLDTASPFDKAVWALGGNSSASKSREMVVVAIRPVVTAARSRI